MLRLSMEITLVLTLALEAPHHAVTLTFEFSKRLRDIQCSDKYHFQCT